MIVLEVVRVLLLIYAAWWTIYLLVPPVAAVLMGANRTRNELPDSSLPAIAVIIPAHDMSKHIERCVGAVRASDYPNDSVTIFVVADHCGDDTAELAENAGATVLTRQHGQPGKTYALAWAIDQLKNTDMEADLFVVTDATARVEPGFLRALVDIYLDGEMIVVGHSLVDAANQKWFARCLGLTLVHRNLQNWSRQRLRLSSLIEGRGMAYSSQYIDEYGWSLAVARQDPNSNHPTEDWRHGVKAVEQGIRVAFADDARVITPLRDNLADATKQGARWEKGRMANAATHAVRLLLLGLRELKLTKILAALDAIQPPFAILGVVSIVSAVLAWSTATTTAQITIGFAPAILSFLYGLIVVSRGKRDGIAAITVLWAPVYLVWRLASFVLAWNPSKKSA